MTDARAALAAACIPIVSDHGALATIEALTDTLLRCLVGLYGEAGAAEVWTICGAEMPQVAARMRLAATPVLGRA